MQSHAVRFTGQRGFFSSYIPTLDSEAGGRRRCPLVAQSRHAQCSDECPLLGAKRTLTNRCLPISIYELAVINKKRTPTEADAPMAQVQKSLQQRASGPRSIGAVRPTLGKFEGNVLCLPRFQPQRASPPRAKNCSIRGEVCLRACYIFPAVHGACIRGHKHAWQPVPPQHLMGYGRLSYRYRRLLSHPCDRVRHFLKQSSGASAGGSTGDIQHRN